MRIALAQLDASPGDVAANLERAASTVSAAEDAGADVVVFPELSLSGYALGDRTEQAALAPGDPRLAALTHAGGAAAVVGLVEAAPGGGAHDSAAWLEDGRVAHVQRKLYLPTYGRFDEGRRFLPGDETAAFDTAHGRAALVVCNDAWQPVVPWLAAQDGAGVLYVLAASGRSLPGERIDIPATWDDLLRAVARLLQVVVVFVNRAGEEGRLRFWGGSRVLGPWGDELARAAGDAEELVVADVDLGAVEAARAEMPLGGAGPHHAVAAALQRLPVRSP
ncbi:MAG TPA: nitrilase-related carbon-nitrogen hydrolase [Gaiellaceae bacterium]|nr:nitrilase-related carbon-nitrogen hydrolase [Gaiellaceae bacterium]